VLYTPYPSSISTRNTPLVSSLVIWEAIHCLDQLTPHAVERVSAILHWLQSCMDLPVSVWWGPILMPPQMRDLASSQLTVSLEQQWHYKVIDHGQIIRSIHIAIVK
jgi:hypothetical protein